MPACIEWATERYDECSRTEDRGYNECTATRDEGYRDCCDWWPCSWACKAWVWISNIVCVAWTWVSNVVCVAWTTITTAVCVLWDVITTVVNAVLVTLESILGWVLSAAAFIVELIQLIPGVGTLVRWIINGVTLLIQVLGSLGDAALGLVGIRPEKTLRLCTVLLRDESGTPVSDVARVVAALQLAADVYKRDANVRLVPLRPFKYTTGFAGAERVDESWVQTDTVPSESDLLDQSCDAGGEWGLVGSRLQWKCSTLCFYGAWRRLLGYGAPITCFVIRNIPDAAGCSLFITDYITVDQGDGLPATSPRTLGHEVGHSCMLEHVCIDGDARNLMGTQGACDPDSTTPEDRANPRMNDWQVLRVRASKHASYF